MKRLSRGLVVLALALTVLTTVGADVLGFDPVKEPEKAADIYFTEATPLFCYLRQPNGVTREFERVLSSDGYLRSVNGWYGREEGNQVRIVSGKIPGVGKIVFDFENGKLTALTVKGKKNVFDPAARHGPLPEAWSALVRSGDPDAGLDKNAVKDRVDRKWVKSHRLLFPWPNPNRNAALYGQLFLLFAALTAIVPRRRVRLACGALSAGCLVPLFLCGSRGAILGVGLAVATCLALSRRVNLKAVLRRKAFWLVSGIAIAALATWICCQRTTFFTRGFAGKSSWSNAIRVELWQAAPKMMVDAPGGWGKTDFQVGKAYLDWYQPQQVVALTGSLINDHLTRLVAFGWCGRWLYFFGWFLALACGVVLMRRRENPALLSVTVAFGAAAWFNPLFAENWLWAVPGVAVVLAVASRPWRDGRAQGLAVLAATLLSTIAVGTLYGLGTCSERTEEVRVKKDGPRVLVNGETPSVWVVDNQREALGGPLSCKNIRQYYDAWPQAPALGYVNRIEDLPDNGVGTLVLGGLAGDAWLRHVTSSAEAWAKMPRHVLFVSPPFPPQAIPNGLYAATDVKILIGEFATWFQPAVFTPLPKGVEIVPGCELYIGEWMSYVSVD